MTRDKQDFDTIQPTEIPLTQPRQTDEKPARYAPQKLMLGVGLAATLLLALAVVFVLPKMVSPPEKIASKTADSAIESSAPTAKVSESPWRDAQLAKARREAQDILSKLLERQKFLENKSVHQWAPERYRLGLDAADAGDIAFRKREFDTSLANFKEALVVFSDLEKQASQTLSDTLDAGFQAITDGDEISARQEFDLALAISPGNADAEKGLKRTESLPAVLKELDNAQRAQQESQLETAKGYYQAALILDGEHKAAKQGLNSVNQQIIGRDYIEALSHGYARLEQGDLKGAQKSFGQALKLRPNASEAKQALNQAHTQQSQLVLHKQLQTAALREKEEAWRSAETLYTQILRNDNSVVAARVGKIRSRSRAELDESIQKLLDNSMRLSSSNVYTDAQKTLQEARKISPKGQRLSRQVASLQTILIKASTPWPVDFQSDNATKVTLFRVGDLGQFDHKTLKLKPGRYVIAGTRKGYRDVRVEFHVTGIPHSGPIIIKCKDPI